MKKLSIIALGTGLLLASCLGGSSHWARTLSL